MSTRYERQEVFRDTSMLCETNTSLITAIDASKRKTEIISENEYPAYDRGRFKKTEIVVSGKRSFESAMDLKRENPESKAAVLNFASAFHPGGGVVNGASAQEECLCRRSTLYPLLYRQTVKKQYYDVHARLNDRKATDAVIYIEDVVIFKTDTDLPELMPEKDWVKVDVMTCAAPDLRQEGNQYFGLVNGGGTMNDAELFGYHVRRGIHLLTVAAAKGADTLVLGAFGCGAFRNDPDIVAKAYRTVLQEFPGVFRKIEFAVFCPPGHSENYDAFSKVFK